MNQEQITERILETIQDLVVNKNQSITPATRLSDLGFDDLDRFELVIRCEDLFHIEITDQQADVVQTVEDLIVCVHTITNSEITR